MSWLIATVTALPWWSWLPVLAAGAVWIAGRLRGDVDAPLPAGALEVLAEKTRTELLAKANREHGKAADALRAASDAETKAYQAKLEILDASDDELLERGRRFADRKRSERTRRGGTVLLICALLWPSSASAEDIVRVTHPHTGQAGYWVSEELWRGVLADAEALPHCQLQAKYLTEAAGFLQQMTVNLQDTVVLERAQLQQVKLDLRRTDLALKAAVRQRDAWYRSPWMSAVGFSLGAALAGFGAWQLTSAGR